MKHSKLVALLMVCVMVCVTVQPAFAIDWNEVEQSAGAIHDFADEFENNGDPEIGGLIGMGVHLFGLAVNGANIVKQLVVGSEAERRAAEAQKRAEEERKKKEEESSWWWPF